MKERLELIDLYQRAKIAYERASAALESIKMQLKEYGSFTDEGYVVSLDVIRAERISYKDIKMKDPELAVLLKQKGYVKTSESERLTVKLKETNDQD